MVLNHKVQREVTRDWNKQYNKFLLTGVYEAISLDQQVTVFNHTIFFASVCVIMNFIDQISESYYELINVCNISLTH